MFDDERERHLQVIFDGSQTEILGVEIKQGVEQNVRRMGAQLPTFPKNFGVDAGRECV